MLFFVKILLISLYSVSVPFEGSEILVTGPSQLAAEAGRDIALAGGNVADVAVAYGLTLSVTGPYFGALGGGGFALIKIGKMKPIAIDFREVAPISAHPDYYKNLPKTASTLGGHAVGVPGFPAGLWHIHKKYGKLPWSKLFSHAIKYAENGFRVSGEWTKTTQRAWEKFNAEGKKHLSVSSDVPKPGQILVQKGLAKALKKFQSQGLNGFYHGDVAKDIVSTIRSHGGSMTLEDLKTYTVEWRKPITTNFSGHQIHLMPPPSSGGVVLYQALKLIEKLKVSELAPLSGEELHRLGEIMNHSFRTRTLLGDPKFQTLPLQKIMSEKYIDKMAKNISPKKTKQLRAVASVNDLESLETTHYSVLDKHGNSIALTVTLNGSYGSKLISKKYGIALNNEMDDFTTKPGEPNMFGLIQGEANNVQPKKRPLSSMSPTLVTKDDKVVMSVGSPGGPRIINAVLQVLYRTLVNGWNVDKAIQAPRVHHQFAPFKLYVDKNRLSPEVLDVLRKKGHTVQESWVARVYAVKKNNQGWLEAAYDSRGEGGASGF